MMRGLNVCQLCVGRYRETKKDLKDEFLRVFALPVHYLS